MALAYTTYGSAAPGEIPDALYILRKFSEIFTNDQDTDVVVSIECIHLHSCERIVPKGTIR